MGHAGAVSEGQAVPARRARGHRTRAALVTAALDLFAAKGVEGSSIDEITAVASVAKGTFYVHFSRKTDVLLERAATVLLAVADERFDGPAPAALELLGARLADEMSAGPRPIMGRMVREIVGNREDWLRVLGDRPTLGALIEPIVRGGQAAGTIRDDLSPARLAQGLTILWLDAVVGWAERPRELALAVDLRRATTLFLHGATVPR